MSWLTPTKWIDRFGDAMELLCKGKRPPDEMIEKWFTDKDNEELQHFAAMNGLDWAQGIVMIDAARVLADTPTEILCVDSPNKDHQAFPY